mmetsp:Transcript_18093/g.68603  ORF Transcript_18093/g.68603 Transcript_18093/m.68603 type:complete len:236 (+) Transcript_18093:1695-2402(+)
MSYRLLRSAKSLESWMGTFCIRSFRVTPPCSSFENVVRCFSSAAPLRAPILDPSLLPAWRSSSWWMTSISCVWMGGSPLRSARDWETTFSTALLTPGRNEALVPSALVSTRKPTSMGHEALSSNVKAAEGNSLRGGSARLSNTRPKRTSTSAWPLPLPALRLIEAAASFRRIWKMSTSVAAWPGSLCRLAISDSAFCRFLGGPDDELTSAALAAAEPSAPPPPEDILFPSPPPRE